MTIWKILSNYNDHVFSSSQTVSLLLHQTSPLNPLASPMIPIDHLALGENWVPTIGWLILEFVGTYG